MPCIDSTFRWQCAINSYVNSIDMKKLLELILRDATVCGIQVLDTAQILVKSS